jgi:hypothetical protein
MNLSKLLLLFLSFFVLLPLDLSAQDHFEGIIRYEVYSSMNAGQPGLMPKYTEYHIKENDLIILVIGNENQIMARILIQGNEGAFYMMDDEKKTALKVAVRSEDVEGLGNVPAEYREAYEKALKKAEKESQFDQFDLEKTGETTSIAGYDCEKYIVRTKNEEISVDTEVWLTDKIKVAVPDALKDKNNPLMIFMDESGYPLKFKGKTGFGSQEQSIEMTAVKVIRKLMDPSDFAIPDDYHVSDMTDLFERK